MLASGYCYDLSILPDGIVDVHACKKKVEPLYHQILHAEKLNLGFIGIPSLVVPLPLMDCQGI